MNRSYRTILLFSLAVLSIAVVTPAHGSPGKEDSQGALVFQPLFKWENGKCTRQGTGSFVRAPKGQIVAVTSAHFIDFCGPPLLQAEWLDVRTGKSVAGFTRSWGMLGNAGCSDPMDLRSDYLLLAVDSEIDFQSLLEIDGERVPEMGERVWFPNKDPKALLGYDRIGGKVTEAQTEYYTVVLDRKIDLTARSGTPVLSEKSGKVIGILSRGNLGGDRSVLYLTPAPSIHKALTEAQSEPLLRDVVGN